MFTKEDYATLTRSQRRSNIRRTIVKQIAITVAYVAVVTIVCNKVENALDSKN